MNLDLQGRRALVTGASAGIGRGIAQALAREGVELVIAGRRRDALENVRDAIVAAEGPAPQIVIGDLRDPEMPKALAADALKALPGIDILVNNAGGARQAPSANPEDQWAEAFDLNFHAARRLTEALLGDITRSGRGRIVNITGSLLLKSVRAGSSAKVALEAWSRGLSVELAPLGVTVNCISPGRINSRQVLEQLHVTEESRLQYIRENIPMGRFGEPEDIGNLAAFLCSPLAGYITGVVIPVDGGLFRMARG